MSTTGTGVNPIALQQDEGEALWSSASSQP